LEKKKIYIVHYGSAIEIAFTTKAAAALWIYESSVAEGHRSWQITELNLNGEFKDEQKLTRS
jgi:hypothetical protein